MALADVFYPGNPKRREKVIRLHQQILDCLKSNFRCTNRLTGLLNKHVNCSFSPIEMNMKLTIKETCDTLSGRITEIQNTLEKIDESLKEQLDPEVFRKLHDMKEHSNSRILIAKKVILVGEMCVSSFAGLVVVRAVSARITCLISSRLLCGLACLGGSILGMIAVGVVVFGIDAIISAILGAKERRNLEDAIREYEENLRKIEPASEAYQDAVSDIILAIKHLLK